MCHSVRMPAHGCCLLCPPRSRFDLRAEVQAHFKFTQPIGLQSSTSPNVALAIAVPKPIEWAFKRWELSMTDGTQQDIARALVDRATPAADHPNRHSAGLKGSMEEIMRKGSESERLLTLMNWVRRRLTGFGDVGSSDVLDTRIGYESSLDSSWLWLLPLNHQPEKMGYSISPAGGEHSKSFRVRNPAYSSRSRDAFGSPRPATQTMSRLLEDALRADEKQFRLFR
jgi:hypothetical protein